MYQLWKQFQLKKKEKQLCNWRLVLSKNLHHHSLILPLLGKLSRRRSQAVQRQATPMDKKRIKGGSTRRKLRQKKKRVARENMKEVNKKELQGVVVAVALAVALAKQKATKGRKGNLTGTTIITTTTIIIGINKSCLFPHQSKPKLHRLLLLLWPLEKLHPVNQSSLKLTL